MKKIKLISLASTAAVLAAFVPVITTSCSSKDNSKIAKYSRVYSSVPQVTFVDSNESSSDTVDFTPIFVNMDDQEFSPSVKWKYTVEKINFEGVSGDDDCVDFSFDNGKLTINYTGDSGKPITRIVEYIVTVSANTIDSDLKGKAVGSADVTVRVIPQNTNILIQNGKQIEIDSSVKLSDFCWKNNQIVLPTSQSSPLTINSNQNYTIQEVLLNTFADDDNKALPDDFLSQCEKLHFLYFGKENSGYTSIGDNFLRYCEELPTFDFGCFNEITKVGADFLRNCIALKYVDYTSDKEVVLESIGSDFMIYCESLQALDFSFLSKTSTIDTIPDSFLDGCSNLGTVKLRGFEKVKTIGNSFMHFCSSFTNFDWSDDDSFVYVEKIGDAFMTGCVDLFSYDLSFLNDLTEVGNYFLSECYTLTDIKLPPNLTTIGAFFLSDSNFGLTTLDMTGLKSLTSIGINFLDNCYELKTLKLPTQCEPALDGWGRKLDKLNTINCGNKLEYYKNANIWKQKAELMVA